MKFENLIKNQNILKVINEMKYSTPTEIQENIIPLIIDGNDVLGRSQTGTGKTIAFAAPILEMIEENKQLQTLILAPTRELAIQIERDIEQLSKYLNIKTVCVYGSSSIEEQIRKIKEHPEIVVGTPGRVKDLMKRKVLNFSEIRFFVLDEADEMLSMGFQEELEFIFEKINNDRQVLLFSATMPKEILKIAESYMSKEYKLISVVNKEKTAKNINQEYYLVNSSTRLEELCRVIDFYNPQRCMIFCRTKRNADEVLEKLSMKHYNADVIHGDITQGQRIATLDRFKSGLFNLLIATDVAARGIHVDEVDLVINYGLPENNDAYVHRIGRTGRAGKSGVAITLITRAEEKMIPIIEKYTNTPIIKKETPKELEILTSKINNVINTVDNYKTLNYDDSLFKDYLEQLNESEIKNVLNKLLNEKLNDSFGSDFSIKISNKNSSPKTRHHNNENSDSTRVFITIGKMDNINKKEILDFLEKKASVKEGTFTKMEIMPKFTFANVDNKQLKEVLNKCNNIKYKNRLLRIEVAKK